MCQRIASLLFAIALGTHSVAWAADEGQVDLDKATELKVTANDLRDLNQVVELLESALEKGLDADNTDFAETMLVGTLLQRATAISSALIGQPIQDAQNDRRWAEVRQFALIDLQRVVSLDDKQYEAHMLIGKLQSLPPGDRNAARAALTKVVDAPDELHPPMRAEAYALRGAVQRLPEKRAADFDKAIELDPEKFDYRLLRARHHYTQEAWDLALADIDETIKSEPENFDAHELRALVLLAQEKPQEALESFNRASELAPQEISPYQYRGELFRQLGDMEKAVEQLNKAIELSPENFLSLAMRSELLLRNDKPEEALKDVDAALKIQPAFVRGHLLRVRILDELGRDDEALAQLEQLAQAAPNEPEIQLQLAAYYIDKDRTLKAIETLTRVIELDSNSAIARQLRGDLYLTVGKHAEALADFDAALAQTSEGSTSEESALTESRVLNNYAWTLATSPVDELRDGKRAIELATKACELTEYKAPHILSTLAASYAEAGDFDKALEWTQKAIDLDKAEHEGQHEADLKNELASYEAKKPFRELQQLEEADDETPEDETFAPPSATPAPARTIDF
ncbi:MAG: tetratricopeptide repeat protein [Pirellulales bacterium]